MAKKIYFEEDLNEEWKEGREVGFRTPRGRLAAVHRDVVAAGGRWGLRNPDQLLAVIQGADALLAAGRPEAARALLAPFTGGGA